MFRWRRCSAWTSSTFTTRPFGRISKSFVLPSQRYYPGEVQNEHHIASTRRQETSGKRETVGSRHYWVRLLGYELCPDFQRTDGCARTGSLRPECRTSE